MTAKNQVKWVYLFQQGNGEMRATLGGKGANLAEMSKIGLPVPPGFVITTDACNYFTEHHHHYPDGLWKQVENCLSDVEKAIGKKLGDANNPLLVSVRSGSPVSMPGMMDTVLNLGLNDTTVEGLAKQSGDRRFAMDSYRRFIGMFGNIVMNVSMEKFERVLDRFKAQTKGGKDTDLDIEQLEEVIVAYKKIIATDKGGIKFPENPMEQLRMAVSAVFLSWNGRRARDYRRVNKIPDSLGTAVNIQTMVFGNLGWDCGTGVAFTRNPSTGENKVYGEYLLNAQGEDVVAGIRTPNDIAALQKENKKVYDEFVKITHQLEKHYRTMQDIEFTFEKGKLYILQTRNGKCTGRAAVRMAVEMVSEGLIDKPTAVLRVEPNKLEQLLHPMVDPAAKATVLTKGLPASPGAARGRVSFDPDEAEEQANSGEKIVLVRHETSPDDFHGMVGAQAILTARGGMTSHAAVVARGMGKPCVAGAGELAIDYNRGVFQVNGNRVRTGEWITIDGSTGEVLLGQVETVQPEMDHNYMTLMGWVDGFRKLKVRANADTGPDATAAREFGAEGIGLCRTEHMFFGDERLAVMREMILADTLAKREQALEKLLPIQRQDFEEVFKAMKGLPVTIRLLDPPLHEFLPNYEELQIELCELKLKLQHADNHKLIETLMHEHYEKEKLLHQVEHLRESNPMLGHRGCRLGFVYPEVTRMQARAIMEAACEVASKGISVYPEIMIPLVAMDQELSHQREQVETVAKEVLGSYGMTMDYLIGTMIELPRAALTADRIAQYADFFSFGTNDLTQTTMGLSRDDSGRFLPAYIERKVLAADPFQVLDREGVGQLVKMGFEKGRSVKKDLKVGICGEHGGEPQSVEFCHQIGMNYVSCSPFRVPIARLAAAQAMLREKQVD